MAPPLPISKPPLGQVGNAASAQGQRGVEADQSAPLAEQPGLINAHHVSQNLSKNANAVWMRMLASAGIDLNMMRQRGMTNRNARQNQPETANQPPAKAPPHPPKNFSANGQNLTTARTLVTALQRRRGRVHRAANRTRPDLRANTDQPEKLPITLAARTNAKAKAAPTIKRTRGPKSPARSRGFAGLLVMGIPVVNPIADNPGQLLNQARVARGG